MLLELSIKDFAIIDELSLTFGGGLNVFTGETGAGKSIIMDAISLVLGDRASNDLIRTGRDEAVVEALFDVTGREGIDAILEDAGLPASESLVIKRVVQRAGRNKVYINGSLATLVTLSEVGARLIDVFGQSDHQSLARPEEHLELLDSFGGHGPLRAAMAKAYRALAAAKKELDAHLQGAKSAAERRDLLSYQARELSDAAPRPGEDAELVGVIERLRNAGKLKGAASGAEAEIYSSEGSVVERLGPAIKALKDAASIDQRLGKTAEALEACIFQLEDCASFLRGYAEGVEADPEAIDGLMARLDLIEKLKKKYSTTVEGLLEKLHECRRELDGIENSEARVKELDAALKAARHAAEIEANKLTEARRKAAKALKAKAEQELSGLGMDGAAFEAMIDEEKNQDGTPRLTEKGAERVTFYISPNPGEEVKPMQRIASGGELSRIMLAMKSLTAEGRVPTLIFDEIDSGVGGAMGSVVGKKLKAVSGAHQVLCITHLPQIAAYADRHFSVSKGVFGARTVTTVRLLDGGGEQDELARMLGGPASTDAARKHAGELIEAARAQTKKKPGGKRPKSGP